MIIFYQIQIRSSYTCFLQGFKKSGMGVVFHQRLFLHLLRGWFYFSLCSSLCNVLHSLVCICWTILASVEWTETTLLRCVGFLMVCFIVFVSVLLRTFWCTFIKRLAFSSLCLSPLGCRGSPSDYRYIQILYNGHSDAKEDSVALWANAWLNLHIFSSWLW